MRDDIGVTTAVDPVAPVEVDGPAVAKEETGTVKDASSGASPEAPVHLHRGCASRQCLQYLTPVACSTRASSVSTVVLDGWCLAGTAKNPTAASLILEPQSDGLSK